MSDKLPVSTLVPEPDDSPRSSTSGAGAPGSSAPSDSTKEEMHATETIAIIKKGIKALEELLGSSAPSVSTKGAKEDLQKAYAEMIAVIKKGIKTLKNQGKPTLDLEVRLAMLDPPRKVPGTKPPLYPR